MNTEPLTLVKILLGLNSVIGALIAVLLTRRLNKNKEKVTLAFELQKEFHSADMSKHRNAAGKIIERYPLLSLDGLNKIQPDNYISLMVVTRFFQRLSLCIEYDQIELRMVYPLFGDLFLYYYHMCYEKNLVNLDWISGHNIKFLAKWFEDTSLKDYKRYKSKKDKYTNLYIEISTRSLNNNNVYSSIGDFPMTFLVDDEVISRWLNILNKEDIKNNSLFDRKLLIAELLNKTVKE